MLKYGTYELAFALHLYFFSLAVCPLVRLSWSSWKNVSNGIFTEATSTSASQCISRHKCKGVRCPPIFSLSNLINAGWLLESVLIYIYPLIAGTNRKAYLLHASFALKDSHCHDHPLMILLWSNNWCLNIYILMNYHNGHQLKAILTNDLVERLIIYNWIGRNGHYPIQSNMWCDGRRKSSLPAS